MDFGFNADLSQVQSLGEDEKISTTAQTKMLILQKDESPIGVVEVLLGLTVSAGVVIGSAVLLGPEAAICFAIGIILLGWVVYAVIEDNHKQNQVLTNLAEWRAVDVDCTSILDELKALQPIETTETDAQVVAKKMQAIFTKCQDLNGIIEKTESAERIVGKAPENSLKHMQSQVKNCNELKAEDEQKDESLKIIIGFFNNALASFKRDFKKAGNVCKQMINIEEQKKIS